MLGVLYKEKQSCKVPSGEAYGVGLVTKLFSETSALGGFDFVSNFSSVCFKTEVVNFFTP